LQTVSINASLIYTLPKPADILLSVEAIPMDDQRLVSDQLTVWGCGPMTPVPCMDGLGQRTWFSASGRLDVNYVATVEVDRRPTDLAGLEPGPHSALPPYVIPYLMPSRYCPSDLLENFVVDTFSSMNKGALILEMAEWIYTHIDYTPGSTGYRATASDVFLGRRGVCRDFAHLMIAFARAADVPARMVSAYALGLNPPDFHAVAEVWLDGRWHLVDPTRLVPETNLVRIAVGRDATDVSFMTIFGSALMIEQNVSVAEA
jgi:transglutaminase-like putative cysteine protease